MGIGNELLGDDGAGMAVARRLEGAPGWRVLLCGTAPENFTAVVRRARPAVLVLVDAVEMGLPAGSVRRIPPRHLRHLSFGTHRLSLYHLLMFLEGCTGESTVIGIQPEEIREGSGLTPPVEEAVRRLVSLLRDHRFDHIDEFGPETH
ncbi:MAG: hydrogenase 3 maturation endopeptidase HyCI [Methanoculleaceae archaeon]